MTTTPEPKTPEQIIEEALPKEHRGYGTGAAVKFALRAAGLLVGAPTEEHPCGDWPAPCNCDDPETHDAGVTPQAECGEQHPYRDAVCVLPRGHEPGHMCEKPAPQQPSEIESEAAVDFHSPTETESDLSPDREKLIDDAEAWLNSPTATLAGGRGAVRKLIDALAVQPVLDPEKVLAFSERYLGCDTHEEIDDGVPYSYCSQHDQADAVDERCHDARSLARALCEAAKRGELS